MKRFLLAVVALVGLVACSRTGATPPALRAAPWQDGDRLQYDWLNSDGTSLGNAEISFVRESDAWAITYSEHVTTLDQTYTLRINAETLRPLSEDKSIQAKDVAATIKTVYSDSKLQIEAVVNGQNRSATIDVPQNAYDNDQLLMTLRALPFAEGYTASLVNVVSANATKIGTTIRVIAQEQITVPAGTYQAWRVELDFGQAKQYTWYQTEAPYHLLQYDNGTTRMVLVSPAP